MRAFKGNPLNIGEAELTRWILALIGSYEYQINPFSPVSYQHSTSPYITHKNKIYGYKNMWIDQIKLTAED